MFYCIPPRKPEFEPFFVCVLQLTLQKAECHLDKNYVRFAVLHFKDIRPVKLIVKVRKNKKISRNIKYMYHWLQTLV